MLESHSILLADDDEAVRFLMARLLRRMGYACHCVADGNEAIEELKSRGYDLLISDVNMPGNADLRLAQEARQLAPEMPVVLLSSRLDPNIVELASQLGVVACFDKALDPSQLARQLRAGMMIRCEA